MLVFDFSPFSHKESCCYTPRGALNFFSGRGVWPGFPKCGASELLFASEKGGLWTENFQIWGLVNWKFPNLEACELKISKFRGLGAKIWAKIEAVEAKISKFSQKGSCELTLLLEMGPLRTAGEAWKGGLQGRTSPYPLSRSVPPPPPGVTPQLHTSIKITMVSSDLINYFLAIKGTT